MASKIRAHQVDQTEIALKEDVVAALPVGTSVRWTGDSADVPAGFMIEDGTAISRTTYPVLWGLYSEGGTVPGKNGDGDTLTTFNLADNRGIGVVGVGSQSLNGRTKTGPSDAYSKQEDQFQGFRVNTDIGSRTVSGAEYNSTMGASTTPVQRVGTVVTDDVNGTPRSGSETRESRLGRYFIVRVG